MVVPHHGKGRINALGVAGEQIRARGFGTDGAHEVPVFNVHSDNLVVADAGQGQRKLAREGAHPACSLRDVADEGFQRRQAPGRDGAPGLYDGPDGQVGAVV